MTKKETIIKAITEMNINLLDVVLEKESYSDVPKELFLKKLEKEFQELKEQGVNNFEKVYSGTCGKCYKGHDGYTFLTKNKKYLSLLVFEKNNKIEDIVRCSRLNSKLETDKNIDIYFSFKEDEKTDYTPSSQILKKQKGIQIAMNEFEKLKINHPTLDELYIWKEKFKSLDESIGLIERMDYNFPKAFTAPYSSVKSTCELIEFHSMATKAFKEYYSIANNEEEMINWLIKYEDNNLISIFGFDKHENWDKNNLILIDDYAVDAKKYRQSIEFIDFIRKINFEYMEKYDPSKEIYNKHGGSLNYKLSNFLFVQNLFPDILKKHNKYKKPKPLENVFENEY